MKESFIPDINNVYEYKSFLKAVEANFMTHVWYQNEGKNYVMFICHNSRTWTPTSCYNRYK